jgi:NAD(P)-dependent dehydrogenase (short-subunit alcohol dehydrogenase family)
MGEKALAGMTAIVTAASSGIGTACARALAHDGASVLINARRADALAQVREAILRQIPDARIEVFVGDACLEADVKGMVEAAFSIAGCLDIAVPAVGGGGSFGSILDIDPADFASQLDLNVLSVVHMIRQAVPKMKSGGSIVCLSSSTVPRPLPNLIPYSVAKAGLEMLVRLMGEELGPRGIRVNAVRPGLTRADSTAAYFADPALLKDFVSQVPLRRGGEPDDIARAVRFLAGPEAAWVTGHCLSADGGQCLPGFPSIEPEGL